MQDRVYNVTCGHGKVKLERNQVYNRQPSGPHQYSADFGIEVKLKKSPQMSDTCGNIEAMPERSN